MVSMLYSRPVLIVLLAACGQGGLSKPLNIQTHAALIDSVNRGAQLGRYRRLLFAEFEQSLSPIPDANALPDSAVALVEVLVDSEGRAVRHAESPVSQSGDWTLTYLHYFDLQGRTAVYIASGRYFSECSQIMSYRRQLAFDSLGRSRDSIVSYTDTTGRVRTAEECGNSYEFFPGSASKDYADLVKHGKAPAP